MTLCTVPKTLTEIVARPILRERDGHDGARRRIEVEDGDARGHGTVEEEGLTLDLDGLEAVLGTDPLPDLGREVLDDDRHAHAARRRDRAASRHR
jgi:hypothetical protein